MKISGICPLFSIVSHSIDFYLQIFSSDCVTRFVHYNFFIVILLLYIFVIHFDALGKPCMRRDLNYDVIQYILKNNITSYLNRPCFDLFHMWPSHCNVCLHLQCNVQLTYVWLMWFEFSVYILIEYYLI